MTSAEIKNVSVGTELKVTGNKSMFHGKPYNRHAYTLGDIVVLSSDYSTDSTKVFVTRIHDGLKQLVDISHLSLNK